MFQFNLKYLFLTVFLLSTEIVIALFVKDTLIRPFIGDVLVVGLIYSFLRIFLQIDYRKLAIGVLIFACLIEILQYFDYVKMLGLENNRILSVVMGRTFERLDFAAYFVGFLVIMLAEKMQKPARSKGEKGETN